MTVAYLLLGSNMGDKKMWLDKAIDALKKHGDIKSVSSYYETEAWGGHTSESFINVALSLATRKSSDELLEALLLTEKELGRIRDSQKRYGERTIDIDILMYGDEIVQKDHLQIPHPRLHERKFALVPLAEIHPNILHPLLNRSISELLHTCSDDLNVNNL